MNKVWIPQALLLIMGIFTRKEVCFGNASLWRALLPCIKKAWAEFFWVHFALIPDGYPPGI